MRFLDGVIFAVLLLSVAESALAETYKDLPPKGIVLEATVLSQLATEIDKLDDKISAAARKSPDASAWVPDVRVFVRAARLAVDQGLFYKPSDVQKVSKILAVAAERTAAAEAGLRGLRLMGLLTDVVATEQLLVGGFVSEIDGSIQPYGVVIPAGFDRNKAGQNRLDVWLHGRGDTKTEVPFLLERMTKPGQYTPPGTIVLHPFGRHCNAFKFAGETDVYESIERLGSLVPIDQTRVAIRGFSMGGAGCWHLAAHDPARWFAANPGAGFVDTIVYQGWQDGTPFELNDTQQKLLNWYDVLPWTSNFRNTNLIAYSGEIDKQRQAADRVKQESDRLGLQWPYTIGPQMGHKIDPVSAAAIDTQISDWASNVTGRVRRQIDFVTYTLRYARADWLTVTGMQSHWQPARVRATITGDRNVSMMTSGVTHLELDFADTGWPQSGDRLEIVIDGESVTAFDDEPGPGVHVSLVHTDGWQVDPRDSWQQRKRPGMQGPIDDALTSKFVFVVPSRPARNGVANRWINRELEFAQRRWREIMRGDVTVVQDIDVTDEQIATCHLICFGDFASNRFLARVAANLPIQWTRDKVRVGHAEYPAATHVPVFCFPNPANPLRYLVVNSGMTFRKFSNTSNSRQIAMLPDWAVLDVKQDYDEGMFPGKVVDQGFFSEDWTLDR